eukprot:2928996-Rhodomonas_salina.2
MLISRGTREPDVYMTLLPGCLWSSNSRLVYDNTNRAKNVGTKIIASSDLGVIRYQIPTSPNFDFALFLAEPTDVREWNLAGRISVYKPKSNTTFSLIPVYLYWKRSLFCVCFRSSRVRRNVLRGTELAYATAP